MLMIPIVKFLMAVVIWFLKLFAVAADWDPNSLAPFFDSLVVWLGYAMRVNRAFPVVEIVAALGVYWTVISVLWVYRLVEKISNWIPTMGGK